MIKSAAQIQKITTSGQYLNELLALIAEKTHAGMALIEVEFIAEHYLKSHNIKGAFKGYQGFPANLCLSVNNCVVHGIPDGYQLKQGDVLKVDCGVNYEGGISDSAITIIIGGEFANPLGYALSKATKQSLDNAVQHLLPGNSLFDYGHTVADTVHKAGFSIIKKLTGHGVGNKVHEAPFIYNYGHPSLKKEILKPGMVIALEPITAITSEDFVMKKNNWNLYCKNGDIGAHWEYTVLITPTGNKILSGITDNTGFFE